VVFGEQSQRAVDQLDVFAPSHAKVRAIAIELGFSPGIFPRFVERLMVLASSAASQREIECDPIEPSKESAIALEGVEFQVRLDERFLDNILGFVGIANDADHGRVETVLVAQHEGFKGRALTFERSLDQFVFVVHSLDQRKG